MDSNGFKKTIFKTFSKFPWYHPQAKPSSNAGARITNSYWSLSKWKLNCVNLIHRYSKIEGVKKCNCKNMPKFSSWFLTGIPFWINILATLFNLWIDPSRDFWISSGFVPTPYEFPQWAYKPWNSILSAFFTKNWPISKICSGFSAGTPARGYPASIFR